MWLELHVFMYKAYLLHVHTLTLIHTLRVHIQILQIHIHILILIHILIRVDDLLRTKNNWLAVMMMMRKTMTKSMVCSPTIWQMMKVLNQTKKSQENVFQQIDMVFLYI